MSDYVIDLPEIPKDFAYEDYVASVLNAGGFYLERGLHKRDKNDILELDIVTNKFTERGVEKTLSEIKSGGWGFPDIFKVRGWMDYLGFQKSSFVVQKADTNQATYDKVSSELGVFLAVTHEENGKLSYDQIHKIYEINITQHEDAFIENLRYSYALERKIVFDISSTANSNKNLEGFKILKQYLFDLCDNTFFEPSPIERIQKVFKLFTEHTHITARLDNERVDNLYTDISADNVSITKKSFDELFYKSQKTNKLYGALYTEMLNRLYILKNCVEELLYLGKNQSLQNRLAKLNIEYLPSNIKGAMQQLRTHAYFYYYPYFWQILIFLFGGFILKDKQEDEYKLLSEITGIPVTEIDNALSVFDLLFPIEKGWFANNFHSSIKILKLMPSPFCGIGVNLRKDVYCKNKQLEELKNIFSEGYTYKDLIKYNNLVCSYLEKSKDVVLVPIQK